MGMIFVAIVMLLMSFGGAPGALLFEAGRKAHNGFLLLAGFALTAIGQAFIVCGYSVFVVSALRAFSHLHPEVPTWPLWIAAFFHSGAVPTYAMKERPEVPGSQHMTLGIVGTAAFICFVIVAFAPNLLGWIYGWIPFFDSNIKG